jgi:hypothetical protein
LPAAEHGTEKGSGEKEMDGMNRNGKHFLRPRALLAMTAIVIGAVLLICVPPAALGAHEKENPGDNVLLYYVYEDNPAFCRRLIEQARQVEFIQPVLPPPRVVWNRNDVRKYRNLGLFFADKAPSTKKRIYEAIRNQEWHEFFDEGNVPAHVDEPNTRVEIVIGSRWRELNDKCPGFVLFGQEEFSGFAIPDRFALYRVDIDNDGAEEYILYQDFFPFNQLRIIDFEACTARKIEQSHTYRPEIVRFEGQNYILSYSVDWISLYRPPAKPSSSSYVVGDVVCSYSPIRKLTDYLDHRMTLKRGPQ